MAIPDLTCDGWILVGQGGSRHVTGVDPGGSHHVTVVDPGGPWHVTARKW